jgi:dihydrofolate synthase/folylpolyglutamate synthase
VKKCSWSENRHSPIDELLGLPRFAGREGAAFKPGLGRIRALLGAMDDPQQQFRSAHVAGSHGKGTTSALVAAVGSAAGQRTGLHTSPHLFAVNERMRIDGAPASNDWLAGAVRRHRDLFERVGPSFFEATVALSLLYFAEKQAAAAVVEVGLGGRLDATNILQPAACAVTSVRLEHTSLLGSTLAEVAREKAGIFKKGVPAVVGADVPPEALAALRDIAGETRAPLHRVGEETTLHRVGQDEAGLRLDLQTPLRRYRGLRVPLYGRHQAGNAAAAARFAELFWSDARSSAQPVRDGFAGVRRLAGLRGRFEVLGRRPLVVADVAHHPDALAATLRARADHFPQQQGRLVVAFGLMRDKDAAACAKLLAEAEAEVWPVALESGRALPPDALADVLRERGVARGPAGTAEAHRQRFLAEADPDDVLLVCGSHRVVAGLRDA